MSNSNRQTQRRYPPELRARAVRMVLETMRETGERHAVVTRVAVELGIGSETVRPWVKQAEIDQGRRPGVTTDERQRIAELEKDNHERARSRSALLGVAGIAKPKDAPDFVADARWNAGQRSEYLRERSATTRSRRRRHL